MKKKKSYFYYYFINALVSNQTDFILFNKTIDSFFFSLLFEMCTFHFLKAKQKKLSKKTFLF